MPVFIKKTPKPVQSVAQDASATMGDFNPILAADSELGKIDYSNGGKIVMPKLNGVRGVNQNGLLMPRSLKHGIKNHHTRNLFSHKHLAGVDGELVVGQYDDEDVFVVSTSGVGSINGKPSVKWWVFDIYHPTLPYLKRLELRDQVVKAANHPDIILIPWVIVHSDEEMVSYADWAVGKGYEGVVLRGPNDTYKEGRSTELEGIFQRYVPWLRSEALILGFEEGKINQNESKRNALGYLAKSSHKDNKVGSGQAGSFQVRDLKTGIEFSMAVPSDALQKEVMANPEKFVDAVCTYKFKTPVKKGGKPRFPQYEGLRADWDMS